MNGIEGMKDVSVSFVSDGISGFHNDGLKLETLNWRDTVILVLQLCLVVIRAV